MDGGATTTGVEWKMSPSFHSRSSVVLPFPFSSVTSMPRINWMVLLTAVLVLTPMSVVVRLVLVVLKDCMLGGLVPPL